MGLSPSHTHSPQGCLAWSLPARPMWDQHGRPSVLLMGGPSVLTPRGRAARSCLPEWEQREQPLSLPHC